MTKGDKVYIIRTPLPNDYATLVKRVSVLPDGWQRWTIKFANDPKKYKCNFNEAVEPSTSSITLILEAKDNETYPTRTGRLD